MSRSRRKPYITGGYGSPYKKTSKRIASRAVRSYQDVPDGGSYKKVSNSWDISDFSFLGKTGKATRK